MPQIGVYTKEDATYSFQEKWRTGEYYDPVPVFNHTAVALAANTLYAMPFIVARDMTIDRLAIDVTAAAGAGAKARLGIYRDGTNMYPGALLLDAGEVAVDGVTVVAATIAQPLIKGLYWLALVSDNTPTIYWCVPTWIFTGLNPASFHINSRYYGWRVAFAYAALPDPFTAGGAVRGQYVPLIAPRIASLD